MLLFFLARFFILSLLCVAVCCIRFYLFENSRLVSDTKLKRVVLKSEPTECLGECVHLEGCKSFNVFYNESRGLLCDLFSISDSMLHKNSFTMHFTVNEQLSTQISTELTTETTTDSRRLPATTTAKTVNPVEEYIVVKKNGDDSYCVSSTLMWILHDTSSNCQLFHFIEGGALRLSNQNCAQNSAYDQVKFSTSPCDDFTFVDSKEQFQYTQNPVKCIRFLDESEPVLDNCHKAYGYKKEHVPQ